ncbi:phage tail tape measure protein (plasmid) [Lysinibacillus capsici]|uniref:phage tail tape measure protein n=1 Tax=Lysinibacillus capsici TaxID=2115968 RepID=UPI0021D93D3A|nr:phage tail tape measure protein [Lysinibacillus capsici]UYB50384.1 phage tail tape measure protein [Lysinibacillus capsici]
MARKALEMTIEIGGRVAGTLGNAFRRATGDIDDLRNRSRQAQRELNRLGNEFRQGRITQEQYALATARITREMRQLEGAQRRIKAISGTLQSGFNTGKAVAGIAAIGTATAVAATAMSSLNTASDFQAQMAKVGAKTEATKEEMKALNQEALRLGASSSLSASQVALAMDELGAKGFDATKIISAMPGLIAATEASGEDLALVSNVVTSAINAYGMEATEATRVADVMAMSANKTAAGVGDLGYSFKYAAPVANTLGIKLEELAAATGLLVDKGLAGEQAGTALRMSLIRLSKPPAEAEAALKELNITATDSKGKFKNLATLAKDWEKSTAKLTETQKVQYAATIFGVEASTAMLSLFGSGPEKIDEMTKALENSGGAAAKAAAIMKDNYAGAKEQMFGALESAQIALATPSLDVLKDTMQGLTGMIEDGMPAIEAAGQKIANGLRDILEPFATVKPELTPEVRHDPEAFKAYEKELAKFNHFNGMDFGDKVIYMLDTATGKMETWLGGSGGEAMTRIFSKLGEIAFQAWLGAFTGSLKAAGSNLMDGNVGGAVGMGAAAWMLGGGAMVKGAVGAGRWAVGKIGGRSTASAMPAPTAGGSAGTTPMIGPSSTGTITAHGPTATASSGPTPMIGPSQTGTITPRVPTATATTAPMIGPSQTGTITPRVPTATASAAPAARTLGSMGKAAFSTLGKVASKAMLPLTVASEAISIYKSNDKVKATSESAGGLAGGLGGAKIGAAIGTAIAPGVGTAIGGLLGGAVGYFGGKWLGGKAVDTVRGDSNAKATSAPAPTPKTSDKATSQTLDTTKLNTSMAQLSTTLDTANTSFATISTSFTKLQTSATTTAVNMDNLTMYSGQVSTNFVTSFFSLKTSTDLSASNMATLASTIGQASGWINSLSGIQTAANAVISSLNSFKARIDNAQVPTSGGATSRRTAYE